MKWYENHLTTAVAAAAAAAAAVVAAAVAAVVAPVVVPRGGIPAAAVKRKNQRGEVEKEERKRVKENLSPLVV